MKYKFIQKIFHVAFDTSYVKVITRYKKIKTILINARFEKSFKFVKNIQTDILSIIGREQYALVLYVRGIQRICPVIQKAKVNKY